MTVDELIDGEQEARASLFAHLKSLEGKERRDAVRRALARGYGASELAAGMGISRGRLYQLKDGAR